MSMDIFYGLKLKQDQAFDQAGKRWPVTAVRVEPLTVISPDVVAFGHKKHLSKPQAGLLKNLSEKISPKYIRSLKFDQSDQSDKFSAGSKIQISDIFAAGDFVAVSAVSKGKGFQGVVRRHHFAGGPKTHGQSDRQRHPGSIGQTTTPGRVYKGKRMAGHMGVRQATIRNLKVFAVKPEENLILIQGLVPGAKNGLVKLTKLIK